MRARINCCLCKEVKADHLVPCEHCGHEYQVFNEEDQEDIESYLKWRKEYKKRHPNF